MIGCCGTLSRNHVEPWFHKCKKVQLIWCFILFVASDNREYIIINILMTRLLDFLFMQSHCFIHTIFSSLNNLLVHPFLNINSISCGYRYVFAIFHFNAEYKFISYLHPKFSQSVFTVQYLLRIFLYTSFFIILWSKITGTIPISDHLSPNMDFQQADN